MTAGRPLSVQDMNLILSHTSSLWEEIRGQRIFLTGGTGFFGCWLVESFCYCNRELGLNGHIVVLTRNTAAFARKCPHLAHDPAVTLHEGDVRTFTFPESEFNSVIHAATDTGAHAATCAPVEMFSTIISGTERVLQFATAHGVRNFLLTSSGAVYGKQPSTMAHLSETYNGAPDPADSGSVYAEGKRAAELLCALYQRDGKLDCKIARCWAFCGPYLPLDQHFAIGNFIGDILAGRPIRIRGDGTPHRSYLYAADLALWLWTILFRAPSLVPINVGSDCDVSIFELAQIVAATLNPNAEILMGKRPVPDTPALRYVPSIERARDILKLRVTVDLEDAIRRTAKWHRS